MNVVDNKK